MRIVNHSFDEDRDSSPLMRRCKSEEEGKSEADSKTANSDVIVLEELCENRKPCILTTGILNF